MIYSRLNNSRVFWLIYSDKTSAYEDLMETDRPGCTYFKNILALVVEMFKISNDVPPAIVSDIFLPWTGHHNNLKQP